MCGSLIFFGSSCFSPAQRDIPVGPPTFALACFAVLNTGPGEDGEGDEKDGGDENDDDLPSSYLVPSTNPLLVILALMPLVYQALEEREK